MANYLFVQLIEQLITLFAWCGLWNALDYGLLNLFESDCNKCYLITYCSIGLFGYLLYFGLLIFERFNFSRFLNKKKSILLVQLIEDFYYFLAFIFII